MKSHLFFAYPGISNMVSSTESLPANWLSNMQFLNVKFFLLALVLATSGQLSQATTLPCNIKLQFDSNAKGSVANYVLSLQLKNTTGRLISGASVEYFSDKNTQLGNTLLRCSSSLIDFSTPVKPGSYGQCTSALQQVDGAFMEAFGSEKWTQIVNSQLTKLNDISLCKVLGFSY